VGVGSVMCSYNKVNGTYACENDKVGTSICTYEKHIISLGHHPRTRRSGNAEHQYH
jgi:hypothetical protein